MKSKKSKKLLALTALSALAYVVLKTLLLLGQTYFVLIYELLAGVPFIVYVCVVRGRFGALPTEEMLPDAWTSDEKKLFISQVKEQHKRGKKCIAFAFPFLAALIIALITEYYLPMILERF